MNSEMLANTKIENIVIKVFFMGCQFTYGRSRGLYLNLKFLTLNTESSGFESHATGNGSCDTPRARPCGLFRERPVREGHRSRYPHRA